MCLFILLDEKYRIKKICLEEIYDIFVINDLCTSLLYRQYTLVYIFLLHYSNLVKVCKLVGGFFFFFV